MVMSTTVTRALVGNSRKHGLFVAFLVVSSLAFYRTLGAVIRYSLASTDSSSHIVLIPIISIFLLFAERQRIFSITRTRIASGAGLALIGIFLYWLANRGFPKEGNWQLSLETIS